MLMACYQGGLACCVYMITDTNFRAVCVCAFVLPTKYGMAKQAIKDHVYANVFLAK